MIRLALVLSVALSAAACGPNSEEACRNVLTCQGQRVDGSDCKDNSAFTGIDAECTNCLASKPCNNGRIDCGAVCSCDVGVVYGQSVCR